MVQELDIPFGRPALAATEIRSGEVSPSQPEVPHTPRMVQPHPSSQHFTPAASISAAADSTTPEGPAAASAASPVAAAEAVATGFAAASSAAHSRAASSGGGSAAEQRSSDGSTPQQPQRRGSPDLVAQRSLSLKTVRTAPSEVQQDDSPVVWCVCRLDPYVSVCL